MHVLVKLCGLMVLQESYIYLLASSLLEANKMSWIDGKWCILFLMSLVHLEISKALIKQLWHAVLV